MKEETMRNVISKIITIPVALALGLLIAPPALAGIVVQGSGGTAAEVDGTAFRAVRVTARPTDYATLGCYSFGGVTGAVGAGMAANGEILQFRWTDASRFAVIESIEFTGMRATTAFAAGAIDIKATIARSWSANGSGGTALTLTGDNQALRTSMGTTLVGDMRIATTAALGAGTKTLDSQDIGFISTHSSGGWSSATPIIGSVFLPHTDLWSADVGRGEHPIVLAQNEGIVVRLTVPATGIWNASVEMRWCEVAAY